VLQQLTWMLLAGKLASSIFLSSNQQVMRVFDDYRTTNLDSGCRWAENQRFKLQ
jgi:hypothetical protein